MGKEGIKKNKKKLTLEGKMNKKRLKQQKKQLRKKITNYDHKKTLNKYYNTVGKNSLAARKIIKELDFQENYYLLRCIAQTYLDESRFKDDGTARIFLLMRKWRLAEKYIIKAFKINPDNAEVLYTMGAIRRSYNQNEIAIFCFKKVIKLGINKIAYGEYGRGISFAKELINDSKFELYRLYNKENAGLAKRYLSTYKNGLKQGISTIYKPLYKYLLD